MTNVTTFVLSYDECWQLGLRDEVDYVWWNRSINRRFVKAYFAFVRQLFRRKAKHRFGYRHVDMGRTASFTIERENSLINTSIVKPLVFSVDVISQRVSRAVGK